jgi:PhoPQ-activated pathogenicity-related protein
MTLTLSVASKTLTPSNITKWVSTIDRAWVGWRNALTDPEHMAAVELVPEILFSDNEDWKTKKCMSTYKRMNVNMHSKFQHVCQ